jgi:hypothetical protein
VGGSVAERYAVSSNSGKKARSQLNCLTFAAGVPITAEMVLNRAAANHGEDDRFTEIENIGLREVLMTQVTMPPARKNSQGTEVRLCGPLLEKDASVDFTKTYAIVFPDQQAIGGSSFSKQSLIDEGFRTFADTLRMAVLRFDDVGLPGILRTIRFPQTNNERIMLIDSLLRIVRPDILPLVNALPQVSIRDVHAAIEERFSRMELTELPENVSILPLGGVHSNQKKINRPAYAPHVRQQPRLGNSGPPPPHGNSCYPPRYQQPRYGGQAPRDYDRHPHSPGEWEDYDSSRWETEFSSPRSSQYPSSYSSSSKDYEDYDCQDYNHDDSNESLNEY